MDFFQNGTITTLHRLCDRPIEQMEAELHSFAADRPMALILPSLYSELLGPALPRIVEQLRHAIGLLLAGGEPVNLQQLAHDIAGRHARVER